jgi:hypothetical protein
MRHTIAALGFQGMDRSKSVFAAGCCENISTRRQHRPDAPTDTATSRSFVSLMISTGGEYRGVRDEVPVFTNAGERRSIPFLASPKATHRAGMTGRSGCKLSASEPSIPGATNLARILYRFDGACQSRGFFNVPGGLMRLFIRLGLERLLVVVLSHLFLRLPSGCNSARQNRLPSFTSSVRPPNREPVIRLRRTGARMQFPVPTTPFSVVREDRLKQTSDIKVASRPVRRLP